MLDQQDTYALSLGKLDPNASSLLLPMGALRAQLGFPSPAEDFEIEEVDLNSLMIGNKEATFLYIASGMSMSGAGILDGDILVVDRSIEPRDGDIVIASWEGNQPTCKRLRIKSDHIELHTQNLHFPHIVLTPETEVELFFLYSSARVYKRGGGRVRSC